MSSPSLEHTQASSFPQSSPTAVHHLNSKGPHKTCKQGSDGWHQLLLQPSKAGQVRGMRANGAIFRECLGCVACLYLQVGEPCTLQAPCLCACLMLWPLLPSVAPIMAPVPLCVSHHHCPQLGVPTCLSTRGEQSRKLPEHYIT